MSTLSTMLNVSADLRDKMNQRRIDEEDGECIWMAGMHTKHGYNSFWCSVSEDTFIVSMIVVNIGMSAV